jgi:hypothetical protein
MNDSRSFDGTAAKVLSPMRSLPNPSWPGSREKFFHVFELNIVGMVDVTYVVDGDPLDPIDDEGEVDGAKMSMAVPPLQNVGEDDGGPSAPTC